MPMELAQEKIHINQFPREKQPTCNALRDIEYKTNLSNQRLFWTAVSFLKLSIL
jgi:hypothetical protein